MTTKRILTAAVLIPLVVLAVLKAPTRLIATLVTLVILLALREFFDLAARAGVPGHAVLTSFCVGLAMFFVCFSLTAPGEIAWAPPLLTVYVFEPNQLLLLFVLGLAVLTIAGRAPLRESFAAIGTSCAALLFVAMPLCFVIALRSVPQFGARLLLFVLVFLWVGDTLAYVVGRWVGRHPMAPRISPNKTWEGALANLGGSVLVGLVSSYWINLPASHLVAMAALGNAAGQLGDLVESLYKRAAHAKDSSDLLPGHGGILDRIDSLIFAAPVVWYYFSVITGRIAIV